MSFARKQWILPRVETKMAADLGSALNIPDLLATILIHRGVLLSAEGREFLYPTLHSLPSPFLMKGMQEAVEIIHQGILAGQPIVVYGDYDVDGVTATAVLVNFFADLGIACRSCHPDRFKDGYGLKAELVEALIPGGDGLVITVDCGISDVTEVERLVTGGMQVIVTDHHQPPGQLPNAHAVLNPWQEGCQFPCKDLAGVGVAFFLVVGLRSYLHQMGYWQGENPPNLRRLLDLVAVGTISDMVPLRGTNRILAKAGLEVLANTDNQGLSELLSRCHVQRGQSINHEDIAFHIGPRLNAAGRMGDAGRASSMLSLGDRGLVCQLAEVIEQENNARRELTTRLIAEAVKAVEVPATNGCPCLILHGKEWHLGLLGIIASKLVDMFAKPVIIFSGNGTLKGSARSIPGINIHEAIEACSEKVIAFGGHSSAAGLSLKEEDLPSFRHRMEERIGLQLPSDETVSRLQLDFLVTDQTDYADLETACVMLAPFGQGNPEPIFATEKPCRLRNVQVIGKEKNHLRFSALLADRWLDGVGFGFGKVADLATNGEVKLTLAFRLKENRFNGQTKPQLMLLDVLI